MSFVYSPAVPALNHTKWCCSSIPLWTLLISFVHPPPVPTLYHIKWACSSIPVWALMELQVPETEVSVVTITHKQIKTIPALTTISPRQVAPVLAYPDGTTIAESGAILLHLLEKFDTEHKLHPPPNSPLRPKFLQHLFYVAAEAYPAVIPLYFATRKPKEKRDRAAVERMMKKYNTVVVKYLERELDYGNRPYLLGDEFTGADMAFGYIIMTAAFCGGEDGEDTLVNEVAKAYHMRCSKHKFYDKLFKYDKSKSQYRYR